jgi:hypothetical protein
LASGDITLSKQEAMGLLAQLPLIRCSDRIEPVSLYPSRCIFNQVEATKDKTLEDTSWVMDYEHITGDSTVCFHHYLTGILNRKKTRTPQEILPHYTGSIHFFSFPISEGYYYQVLLAYKP